MTKRSRELYTAVAVCLAAIVLYLTVARNGLPPPGGPFGHGLGVVGFLLMLGAETLYSLRKQAGRSGRGRLQTWLQAHIFIGIVGPLLVLLHSAWHLNGLAGVVMLLTMLMVASGFLCSYVYSALPRAIDGSELAMRELDAQIAAADTQVQDWVNARPAVAALVERLTGLAAPAVSDDAVIVLGHTFLHWGYQRRLRQEIGKLDRASQGPAQELAKLLDRRYVLAAQSGSLLATRSLLAQTRRIHVELGVVLFALAFVHIGAALYYAVLAH
ncbi:MAG: hypothetical protein ACYC5O_08555 [Anaerolineae bacterium]